MIKLSERVIELADAVIESIDTSELLTSLAVKNESTDSSKTKLSTEKQKRSYIEALAWKGCALARLQAANAQSTGNLAERIDEIWKEILKFIDVSDLKTFKIGYRYQELVNNFYSFISTLDRKVQNKMPLIQVKYGMFSFYLIFSFK